MNVSAISSAEFVSDSPDATYAFGQRLGENLGGGEVVLLSGGLGAGKTLLTKGIADGAGFDPDEVSSPSFALVNLYKAAKFDIFHIDLWRITDNEDPLHSVGLDEILDDQSNLVIIEWAEKLPADRIERPIVRVTITGDGDDPRQIKMAFSNS